MPSNGVRELCNKSIDESFVPHKNVPPDAVSSVAVTSKLSDGLIYADDVVSDIITAWGDITNNVTDAVDILPLTDTSTVIYDVVIAEPDVLFNS